VITLRSYEPERDAAQAYALWQQTLGQLWPLPFDTFQAVTVANPAYQPADHIVACSGEELVGLLATQVRRDTAPVQGHLLVLLVAPAFQRQGIGRRLHAHALRRFREQGVTQIQLGGGLLYFWQGVPFNLPAAWAFFQAQGWQELEQSFDLTRTLIDYTTDSRLGACPPCAHDHASVRL
jgi:GNAT superfamily N-acetyltransferase